jgi:hypothetical protein
MGGFGLFGIHSRNQPQTRILISKYFSHYVGERFFKVFGFLLLMRSTLKKQEAQRCDIYGALFVFITVISGQDLAKNLPMFTESVYITF